MLSFKVGTGSGVWGFRAFELSGLRYQDLDFTDLGFRAETLKGILFFHPTVGCLKRDLIERVSIPTGPLYPNASRVTVCC